MSNKIIERVIEITKEHFDAEVLGKITLKEKEPCRPRVLWPDGVTDTDIQITLFEKVIIIKSFKVKFGDYVVYYPETDKYKLKSVRSASAKYSVFEEPAATDEFKANFAKLEKKVRRITQKDKIPYAIKKKINVVGQLIDDEGSIVVTGYNSKKELIAIQRINLDFEKSNKLNLKGSKTNALGIFSKDREKGKMVLVAEGFATAASIAMANPNVISCYTFGISCLTGAYEIAKRMFPASQVIIALDKTKAGEHNVHVEGIINDIKTRRIPYIQPSELLTNVTDYNDIHVDLGLKELALQLHYDIEQLKDEGPIPLSLRGSDITLYSKTVNQFIKVSSPRKLAELSVILFSQTYLLNREFNSIRLYRELATKASRVQSKDQFRGLGIYSDNDKVTLNAGDRFVCKDGKIKYSPIPVEDGKIYINAQDVENFELNPTETLDEDIKNVEAALKDMVNFSIDGTEKCLLASIVMHLVHGYIEYKPHIWLLGQSTSGKSSILDKFYHTFLGPLAVRESEPTKAGIVQKLNKEGIYHYRTLLLDEGNKDAKDNSSAMESIIETLRSATTDSRGAQRSRGTGDGGGITFKFLAPAVITSVFSSLKDEQDSGRFIELFLLPNPKRGLVKERKAVSDASIKLRHSLVPFVMKNINFIKGKIDTAINTIPNKFYEKLEDKSKFNGHKSTGFSTLVGCYSAVTGLNVDKVAEMFYPIYKANLESLITNPSDDFISSLLSTHFRGDLFGGGETKTLEEALGEEYYRDKLFDNYGIWKAESKGKEFINIVNKPFKLANLMFFAHATKKLRHNIHNMLENQYKTNKLVTKGNATKNKKTYYCYRLEVSNG